MKGTSLRFFLPMIALALMACPNPVSDTPADQVVTILTIPGIVAPVRGAAQGTTAIDTAQYTGAVSWSPNDNPFAATTIYTASIELTAKAGWTLAGVAANSFAVIGATAKNAANSGSVSAVFPATAAPADHVVTLLGIPGIETPVRGAVPATTPIDTEQYTGTISWSPADSPFAPTTVYTANIALTPKTGWTLTGVGANAFSVTGANATNEANSGNVAAVFPATGAAADIDVSFISAEQVGGVSNSVTTTSLTLTFSADPTTLTASDIALAGAAKGSLTGTGTTRNLAISDVNKANGETVSVTITSPAGYAITGSPKTAVIYKAPTPVAFTGLTANGTSGTATTTELTLSFSADPAALALSDITVAGAAKVTLTGTGTTRNLAISDIEVANGATVSVSVASPEGYTVTGSPRTVAVYKAPTAVAFLSAVQAGGASNSATTTSLTLNFSADPTTLSASDITIDGATKGALTGTGATRDLAISDITKANGETVSVAIANPTGYAITGSPQAAVVYKAPTAVIFASAVQVGGASNSVTTTSLTLTFNVDPTTLSAANIAVTGATKGALSGTGTTRSLAISDITVANGATVSVLVSSPAGYTITGSPQTAVVYKAPTAVTFSSVAQAGGASNSVTTTSLTLTFSVDPTTLSASNITVTGAAKGALTGTGTTRSLAISSIRVANNATITVSISSPDGFTIAPSSRTAVIYRGLTYSIGESGPSGIGIVFYTSDGGSHGLEAAPTTWNGGSSDPSEVWITGGTTQTTLNGNTGIAIGAGYANSEYIVAQAGHVSSAAQLCRAYRGGSKDDWFLPSDLELYEMYRQNAIIGGFYGNYWSSWERDAATASTLMVTTGVSSNMQKSSACHVRPIRAF